MSNFAVKEENPWLTRKEAARFLTSIGYPITYQTLEKLPSGRTPPYNRTGHRTVRYHKDDLRDWAARNTKRIT